MLGPLKSVGPTATIPTDPLTLSFTRAHWPTDPFSFTRALGMGQIVKRQSVMSLKQKKNSFLKNQDNARLFLRPHKVFMP